MQAMEMSVRRVSMPSLSRKRKSLLCIRELHVIHCIDTIDHSVWKWMACNGWPWIQLVKNLCRHFALNAHWWYGRLTDKTQPYRLSFQNTQKRLVGVILMCWNIQPSALFVKLTKCFSSSKLTSYSNCIHLWNALHSNGNERWKKKGK